MSETVGKRGEEKLRRLERGGGTSMAKSDGRSEMREEGAREREREFRLGCARPGQEMHLTLRRREG